MPNRTETIETLNIMLGDIDHATDERWAMVKRNEIQGAARMAHRLGLITMPDWKWYDDEAGRACQRRHTQLAFKR